MKWHQFGLLEGHPLKHGCFTRSGGVSQAPFDTLNLSYHVGDQSEHVDENRRRIARLFGVDRLHSAIQVHGSQVVPADGHMRRADGLITKDKGKALLITHADCQAAILYDPQRHCLAAVHCGWRGLVANLYAAAVASLKFQFQSKPSDLLVCISPSLGPASAEFIHYRTEFPKPFWKHRRRGDRFNLWEIAREQLIATGIRREQIEIASICSLQGERDWFSFRREKRSGRSGTVAMLC